MTSPLQKGWEDVGRRRWGASWLGKRTGMLGATYPEVASCCVNGLEGTPPNFERDEIVGGR